MMVYVRYSYRSRTRASIVIHTAGDPAALTGAVRQAIWRVDPEIAIANARPMEQLVDAALGGRRYQMTLFTPFSAVALAVGTLVGGLLFEVSVRDPIVIAATAALMGAIGLVACVVAARQGLSLNPAAVLRDE